MRVAAIKYLLGDTIMKNLSETKLSDEETISNEKTTGWFDEDEYWRFPMKMTHFRARAAAGSSSVNSARVPAFPSSDSGSSSRFVGGSGSLSRRTR